MDGEEEYLELGSPRRGPGARIAAAVLIAAAVGGYAVVHAAHRGTSHPAAAASATTSAAPSPPPSEVDRPPWPQRAGACGNTAFLPLVSAQPLDRRTGVRAVVGDRLDTVDVDTGAVTRAHGLPSGEYADQIVTAGGRTYALLRPCGLPIGASARVVRVGRDGALTTVARGSYDRLIGGDRPRAVLWDEAADRTTVDQLDGSKPHRIAATFSPVAGYRGELIGGFTRNGSSALRVQARDPRTGALRLDLGRAGSMTVSGALVVWTDVGCTSCRLHFADLRTGRRGATRTATPGIGSAWDGVASPDQRTLVFVRQSARPAPYDMGHPGHPNEIVTVDLRSGAVRTVPGVELWSQTMPGLGFSADSRWLLISLDEGTGTRLLLWRPGLRTVRQSPARLTTRVAFSPGLAAQG